MKHLTKLFPILAFTVLLNGCKAQAEHYYAYSIGTYVKDGDSSKILYQNKSISFGHYLIEFKMRINFIREVYTISEQEFRSIEIDTIGLYVMSENSDTYAEFDKFDAGAKMVKYGKVSEKETGSRFSMPDTAMANAFFKKKLRDTLVNSVPLYVIDSSGVDESGKTTFLCQLFLVKAKDFKSVYTMSNIFYPNHDYAIVGYHYYYPTAATTTTSMVESMRPLTEPEIKICSALVEKYHAATK